MREEANDAVTARGVGDVALIDPLERDVELDLHSPEWGEVLTEPWAVRGKPARHFYRDLKIHSDGRRSRELRDYLLRFPSAPIYGINRRQSYEVDFTKERPNLHTLRLLIRPAGSRKPVTRLFILHNGLNESHNLRFFYQLADWILREDETSEDPNQRSACLLAPSPVHLMHFPFAGPFAQTPLSRYLEDAGDLFRHFMRYMVEMRWLFSMINDPPPPWMVGGNPIDGPKGLNAAIADEWSELRDASFDALTSEAEGDEPIEPNEESTKDAVVGPDVDAVEIDRVNRVLRWLLRRAHPDAPPTLPVNVVGYSLGGFLAQSVFFAWPNIVSSCSTICSGGAIRALSPTAFAHSEEWQSVLHSLRPEIEGSMLGKKIARDADGKIIGMPVDQFEYFHRIFNQVFLQEDQASYKQRLTEYGSRMLFVSGGEDPIVKTRDVLDASPDEGITMLSVARLTHFLGESAQTDREVEQRQFWLPEAGGLIARAAGRAEELKIDEFEQASELRGQEGRRDKRNDSSREPDQRDLASPSFEQALDWVVELVERDAGWLFVCRNGIPTAFLSPVQRAIQGAALHHHDVAVQDYVGGLARRARTLEEIKGRTMLCLSKKLKPTFIGTEELFDSHSDALGEISTKEEREDVWNQFIATWEKHVRWFKAGSLNKPEFARVAEQMRIARTFARRTSSWQNVPLDHFKVSRLPDVWISLKEIPDVGLDPHHPQDVTVATFVAWVSKIVAEQQSASARKRKQSKSNELKAHLKAGRIRIVRVSGTELNPRYRGRFETSFSQSLLLLAHCAASLVRTTGPAGRVTAPALNAR